jgi:hypothetical protein
LKEIIYGLKKILKSERQSVQDSTFRLLQVPMLPNAVIQRQMMNKNTKNIILFFILWLCIGMGHFGIAFYGKSSIFIALLDPIIHGLIAFVIIMPFYINRKISIFIFISVVLITIFIDLDHVIMAKSFNPYAIISLPNRPMSHSIIFSFIIAVFCAFIYFLYSKTNFKNFIFFVYLFGIALISHVMRDVTDGSNLTPWLFPFKSYSFPSLLFFILFVPLTYLHYFMSKDKINLDKLRFFFSPTFF